MAMSQLAMRPTLPNSPPSSPMHTKVRPNSPLPSPPTSVPKASSPSSALHPPKSTTSPSPKSSSSILARSPTGFSQLCAVSAVADIDNRLCNSWSPSTSPKEGLQQNPFSFRAPPPPVRIPSIMSQTPSALGGIKEHSSSPLDSPPLASSPSSSESSPTSMQAQTTSSSRSPSFVSIPNSSSQPSSPINLLSSPTVSVPTSPSLQSNAVGTESISTEPPALSTSLSPQTSPRSSAENELYTQLGSSSISSLALIRQRAKPLPRPPTKASKKAEKQSTIAASGSPGRISPRSPSSPPTSELVERIGSLFGTDRPMLLSLSSPNVPANTGPTISIPHSPPSRPKLPSSASMPQISGLCSPASPFTTPIYHLPADGDFGVIRTPVPHRVSLQQREAELLQLVKETVSFIIGDERRFLDKRFASRLDSMSSGQIRHTEKVKHMHKEKNDPKSSNGTSPIVLPAAIGSLRREIVKEAESLVEAIMKPQRASFRD